MADAIHAIHTIRAVDEVLADANAPTYSQAMHMLLELARATSAARGVDTHTVFKAWRMLDRWSTTTGPERAPQQFPSLDNP